MIWSNIFFFAVERVHYPGLPTSPSHKIAMQLFTATTGPGAASVLCHVVLLLTSISFLTHNCVTGIQHTVVLTNSGVASL